MTQHLVASIATLEHHTIAYIGCAPGKDPRASGASAWFITENADKANRWDSRDLAREFRDRLTEGEAYGLKNDGRLWHVHPAP